MGSSSEYSTQGLLHCKRRNQGCSSAEGRPSTSNSGTKAAVLPKAGLPHQTQEPRLQFCRRQAFHIKLRNQGCSLPGMTRCGSFSLFSAPHSPFSIWTDFERSEKIPVAPTRRWREWIWPTGPSGLHRKSPQGLNISFIRGFFYQIRDPEISITLRPRWYSGAHVSLYPKGET